MSAANVSKLVVLSTTEPAPGPDDLAVPAIYIPDHIDVALMHQVERAEIAETVWRQAERKAAILLGLGFSGYEHLNRRRSILADSARVDLRQIAAFLFDVPVATAPQVAGVRNALGHNGVVVDGGVSS